MQPLGWPALAISFPGPKVAFAKVDASSWVTNWQGSRSVGDSDPDGDADAGADEVEGADGEAGPDVAGGGGGSGVGVADVLDAGAGVADVVATADTFVRGAVTAPLLDDLQDVMSRAGDTTTRMSAMRRCIRAGPQRSALGLASRQRSAV
jgi:hypothetical protein